MTAPQISDKPDEVLHSVIEEICEYAAHRNLDGTQIRAIFHAGIGATAAFRREWVCLDVDPGGIPINR